MISVHFTAIKMESDAMSGQITAMTCGNAQALP